MATMLCHLLPLPDATSSGTSSLATTHDERAGIGLQLSTYEIKQCWAQPKHPCPRPLHTPIKPSLDAGTHGGRNKEGQD